jgi:predicted nucleic acid-binding protein
MIEDAAAEQVARISQRLQEAERRIGALERESDLLIGALAIQMEWADSGAPPPPPDIAAAVRAIVQRHRVLH